MREYARVPLWAFARPGTPQTQLIYVFIYCTKVLIVFWHLPGAVGLLNGQPARIDEQIGELLIGHYRPRL